MWLTRTWLGSLALALAACDGGAAIDAGDREDAGRVDSGGVDAGRVDAGGIDAGRSECGSLTLPALTTQDIIDGADWSGFFPVAIVQPPGEDEDLYVVSQDGRIVIVRDRARLPTPFIDLRGTVDFDAAGQQGERGLLGLAFHPDYATNGRFFVYYTSGRSGSEECNTAAHDCRNIVAEYQRSASPDVAMPNEMGRPLDLLDVVSSFGWNHNGGMVAFGPDGYLYAGVGDGGAGNDPDDNAQDLDSPFGKIHRIDVGDAAGDYSAPPDNPFVGSGVDTIWAFGLRNPWRFSFDSMTGDMWIGDVGQSAREELDFQPASSGGGENYGWPAMEGLARNSGRSDVPVPDDAVEPALDYGHPGGEGVITGLAVTGGYVYRGADIPALRGWYVFGDFFTAPVAALRFCEGAAVGAQEIDALSGVLASLTSFGEDNAGELYLVGNSVVRIAPAP